MDAVIRAPTTPGLRVGAARIGLPAIGACVESTGPNAPPRHVQPEPHTLAFAYLPVLLQVLRVRDAQAHLHEPDEVLAILDRAVKRHRVKELLVLTGERPEVNAGVAAKLGGARLRGLRRLRHLGL